MLCLNYGHVILLFLTTSSVIGHEGFLYFHKMRNSSVDISCESAKKEEKLFAFSLKRRLIQPRQVLYLYNGSKPSINKSGDKDRITARDKLDNHTVYLRISNLQGWDTDIYYCEFHYGDLPYDISIPGKMEFFIYVEDFNKCFQLLLGDCNGLNSLSGGWQIIPPERKGTAHEPCNCLSYLPLLYVISAAVCLLGVVVVTFALVYCCKWPKTRKPQTAVPVYEEMAGVRPAKEKTTNCDMEITKLQDANSSVSALLNNENLYVKPKSTKCFE